MDFAKLPGPERPLPTIGALEDGAPEGVPVDPELLGPFEGVVVGAVFLKKLVQRTGAFGG